MLKVPVNFLSFVLVISTFLGFRSTDIIFLTEGDFIATCDFRIGCLHGALFLKAMLKSIINANYRFYIFQT